MSAHSGVIGEAEGLDQLYAEYERGNPVIKAKIGSLQARFKQMRRIRGDGNCFYRAFAVGLLSTYPQVPSASWTCEACSLCNQDNLLACSVCDTPRAVVAEAGRQKLLALVNSSLLQPFASNRLPHLSSSELQFATADSVQNIQRLLQFLSTFELTAPATANILAKQVFGQRELTDALVGLFRVLAADYLRAHEPELSPFLVEGDMDSYISTQVLVDSVEGEGLAITALTNVFRDVALVRIHFLNSDATPNNVPAIYEYPSDSSEPEAPRLVLNLLFRPGHYDLLLE